MSSRSTQYVAAMANINILADGVYDALIRDDISRAMQLSWHLMQQQHCPVQLQAQAVLVHSGASLMLGGDVVAIEGNLQSMIKRIGFLLSKMPMQGAEAPEVVRALGQLRAAVASLRTARSSPRHHSYPSKNSCLDMDQLIQGFGKMGISRRMCDMVVIREEEDGLAEARRSKHQSQSHSHSTWRHQSTCA